MTDNTNEATIQFYCGNACGTLLHPEGAPSALTRHEWKKYCMSGHPWQQSEIIITDPSTGGKKGQKDVRLHAAPWESLSELGRVFAFGEQKYDDYNFRKGYKWSLSFDAMQRHAWAFWNREDRDAESGLHHLAHAAWHGLVLLFFSLTGRGTDDRPQ